MREQDEHLDEIQAIALRLKEHTEDITNEVDSQQGMIRDLGHGIDKT